MCSVKQRPICSPSPTSALFLPLPPPLPYLPSACDAVTLMHLKPFLLRLVHHSSTPDGVPVAPSTDALQTKIFALPMLQAVLLRATCWLTCLSPTVSGLPLQSNQGPSDTFSTIVLVTCTFPLRSRTQPMKAGSNAPPPQADARSQTCDPKRPSFNPRTCQTIALLEPAFIDEGFFLRHLFLQWLSLTQMSPRCMR